MNMLPRSLLPKIDEYLLPNKVLVIYGPRQVGKTTLIKEFLKTYPGKVYGSTGENAALRDVLLSRDFARIIPFFSDYDLIFIDEAQQIPEVGEALKIIVDQIEGIKVIATGSSSFDLANKVGEPLVGRKHVLRLYPIWAGELRQEFGRAYLDEQLENLMVYGLYPEAITARSFPAKREYLEEIRDAYLYKDILEHERIKNSKILLDLLRLLAWQIGQEVSLQELGNTLGISKNTVAKYLDLLEKAFVLYNVRGFSRNLRKEVSKTSRYYFYDNGVRNAVIENFQPVSSRNDIGQLWENFVFMERLKKRSYLKQSANIYFWRTWDKKEIDLVEEYAGELHGYEFKWKKTATAPEDWQKAYPGATFQVVNRDNYHDFIL